MSESYKTSLFSQYPRIIGYPVKIKLIYNMKELNNYINQNMHKYGIHLSLYSFTNIIKHGIDFEIDYLSAIIDKIYLDIDIGNWLDSICDVHYWCKDNDILHRIHLSSDSGSHLFIGCTSKMQWKKKSLYNAQYYIVDKFKIEMETGAQTIFGDTARSFRVPNTLNFKNVKNIRYCIPITDKELETLTLKELQELTLEPRKLDHNFWYGSKLLNMKPFDTKKNIFREIEIEINENDLMDSDQLEKLDIPYDKFPACIQKFLSTPDLGHYGRLLLTSYLREQQFAYLTDAEIISILKSILNTTTWIHASTNMRLPGKNVGENLKPIKKALSNMEKSFPSCRKMRELHFCPNWYHCPRQHPIYKY